MHDTSVDPTLKVKARGALSNLPGRFERHWRLFEPADDSSGAEPALLRTETRLERPRRIISYNRSPDLPFDRSINPYRGCEHGCIYCFARPTHTWLGMSAGLDFETRLVARPEAPEVLARELSARGYRVAPIAIGTNTDPYQPIEKNHEITRSCLKVLKEFGHPVAIVTKGSLVERDIDILKPMAKEGLVRVGISLTTLDPDLSRAMEPRAPTPERRLITIRRLSEAGIPVRIMMSPIIPGLTDHEIEKLLAEGAEAGASAASWVMLRLPREVSELFQEWVMQYCPNRAGRIMGHLRDMHGGKAYDAAWGRRMRGSGPYAELVGKRFDIATRRLGLYRAQPDLRCDLFAPPHAEAQQLSLF